MRYLAWLSSHHINLGGEYMQQLASFLPILILVAFPLLYFGGHQASSLVSLAGILVLFLGMSGPLLKRMKKS
ncbi:hypothetical protein SPSPH_035560 [Sporomusa sphaeroides DSM 2875]|uniref:Uncharacterized protein n=2 Tax=Sporomusa TaxID=2375 RepID=A0ABM9W597_9FIRM|nr:hypothetical protein SPSPH_33190 [Sporomusa sphaeroides DSM 2875]CVK20330.1 hypothetical protein SSPH_02998 [Sporomusa sphaeroides DSM 2875]